MYFLAVQQEGIETITSTQPTSTVAPRLWSQHIIFYKRKPELLRETANSRSGAKMYKMNLKHLPRKQGRETRGSPSRTEESAQRGSAGQKQHHFSKHKNYYYHNELEHITRLQSYVYKDA